MHELFCITGHTETNITPIAGNLTWRSNTEELGDQLDFELAYSDTKYFPANPVNLGSLVVLRNNGAELFRGIVTTEQRAGRGPIQYSTFDYGFYLNKSQVTYQFKTTADKAISKILADFKIPVGKIATGATAIKKIYPGDVVSDIIKDIMAQVTKATGVKLRMEMRAGKLYIEKQTDLLITATFSLAANVAPVSVTEAIGSPSRKRSIEEMKNSIIITSGDEKAIKTVAKAQNTSLISQYGLLQQTESVDKADIAKAKHIAANKLAELAKIGEENSIELIGNDSVRAGRIIELTEPITGMSGKYLIKDCTHTLKNGLHTMSLGLGVV